MPIIYKFTSIIAVLSIISLSPNSFSQKNDNDVILAMGYSLAPYVFENGNGIISDIIRESLKLTGRTSQFKLYSNAEAINHFLEHKSDGIAVVTEEMVDAYLSVPYIVFQNHAITLKKNNINLKNISDLNKHSLIAFSNAQKYLGKKFFNVTKDMNNYREVSQQTDQLDALFKGKVDVIIADKVIFKFYQRKLRNQFPMDKKYRQQIEMHSLFPPSIYHVAFHDKNLRDDFNKGFKHLEESGQTDNIVQTYTNLLQRY